MPKKAKKVTLSKAKKVRHISLKSLRGKAWKLISEYVRRQGADKQGLVFCFTCGKKAHYKTMDCGHYIHKNCLDYDLVNLKKQCTRCNRFLHGNTGVYAERLIAEYGEQTIAELRVRSQQVKKFTIFELLALQETYKQKILELGGTNV